MEQTVQTALAELDRIWPGVIERLCALVRIPSVSAGPPERFPPEEVARSAEAVARDLREQVGFPTVEVWRDDGVHPYVYAEWLGAPGRPTVLLYAHHDVQPPGRADRWTTPPFEPQVRDGRLYGRGAADDKAGYLMHAAACGAYLRACGALPLNVKLIVEGEEEIGSEHLGRLLATRRDRLAADFIVLSDTANLDVGVPSITYRLRGLVAAEVEVAALDHPLHSGMWGGATPDATLSLCRILARLVDERGRIAIPGVYDKMRPIPEAERRAIAALPYDEARFCEQAGYLPGIRPRRAGGAGVYEQLWCLPSLSIHALESSPIEGSSNQIVPAARARVGIRTVPDQVGSEILDLLVNALTRDPPDGVRVRARPLTSGSWWVTDPTGPAFSAAARALEQGYGRPCTFIGAGGSIPFVQPFCDVLGGAPAILLGVEDPCCNAHSENESLHLSDFRKGTESAVRLYAELGRLSR